MDAAAVDIMNSNVDLSSTLGSADQRKSGNPGLQYIWEDEKLRRTVMRLNSKKHPLTPPSSPPRNRPPDHATESEKHWEGQYAEALSEWTKKGVFDKDYKSASSAKSSQLSNNKKVVVFPDVTADGSLLQPATKVEDHLASLSITIQQQDSIDYSMSHEATPEESEKNAYFQDTLVDEASMIELLGHEAVQAQDSQILDSDDDELIELLHELKQANEPSTSHQDADVRTTSRNSSSQSTLLSSQFSQLQREKYEQEVADTLEMSQICWDEDPFANEFENDETTNDDGFDNESFWETYDFESALK